MFNSCAYVFALFISGRFPCMKRMFPGNTPVISTELAALLNDAVARDKKGDRVAAHCRTYSPGSIRVSYGSGYTRIAGDLSWRNLQQGFPYIDLKIGTRHV